MGGLTPHLPDFLRSLQSTGAYQALPIPGHHKLVGRRDRGRPPVAGPLYPTEEFHPPTSKLTPEESSGDAFGSLGESVALPPLRHSLRAAVL
jgi:hypothetical protein